MCAWSKLRLSWIETNKIIEVRKGENKTVLLGPLNSEKSQVHVIKLPITSTTYYLTVLMMRSQLIIVNGYIPVKLFIDNPF